MCVFAKTQMTNKLNVKISNLGEKINSPYADYGPIMNADESIMVFRFQSTDPGIMMHELGRTMVHIEGLELIKQWISSLK